MKLNWWLIVSIVLVVVVLLVVFNFTGNAVRSSKVSNSLNSECVSQCKSMCNGSVIIKMRCKANCDSRCDIEAKQQQSLVEADVGNPDITSMEEYNATILALLVNKSYIFTNSTTKANEMAVGKNGRLVSIFSNIDCGYSRTALPIIASQEFEDLVSERNLTIILVQTHTVESMRYSLGEIFLPSIKVWNVSVNGSSYIMSGLGMFAFRDSWVGLHKSYSSFGFSSKCYSYSAPIELSAEGFMRVVDDVYNGGSLLKLTKQISCP